MSTTAAAAITASRGPCRRLPALAGLLAAALLLLPPARAGAVGAGVLVGTREPDLALSLKSGLGSTAQDVALSWSNGVYLHADYLVHVFLVGRTLPFYAGLGGRLLLADRTDFALRIPLGVALIVSRLELFFEVVPQVRLYPDLARDWVDPNLGLGLRLHFR